MWICSSHLGELRMIQARDRVYRRAHTSSWVDNRYPSFLPGKQAYWTFHVRIKDKIHHNRIMRKWMQRTLQASLRIHKSKTWQLKGTKQPLFCSLCNISLICTLLWGLNYKGVINVPSKRDKVSSKSQVHLSILLHFQRGLWFRIAVFSSSRYCLLSYWRIFVWICRA